MPLSMSPAAVSQCFTLVSLCTSIADPNWIQVQNSSEPGGKQLIYGVAFTLHASQNITDTGPLGGAQGWGMWLLYALAGLCYSAVPLSSASFLMDFLGTGLYRPRLLASLYISTVLFFLSILGVCGACLYIIYHNLQGGRLGGMWPSAARAATPRGVMGAGSAGLQSHLGESFYISVLGLVFSCVAAVICVSSPWGPAPQAGQGGYTAVVSVDEEDEDLGEHKASNTKHPTHRQQGCGVDWEEVLPEEPALN